MPVHKSEQCTLVHRCSTEALWTATIRLQVWREGWSMYNPGSWGTSVPQKLCEALRYGYKSEERVGVCTTPGLEEPVKRTAMKVNSYWRHSESSCPQKTTLFDEKVLTVAVTIVRIYNYIYRSSEVFQTECHTREHLYGKHACKSLYSGHYNGLRYSM